MTSFKPMWATPATAPRAGASANAKKDKPVSAGDFKPLWLDPPSARDFLAGNKVVTTVTAAATANAPAMGAGMVPAPATADGDEALSRSAEGSAEAGAGEEDGGMISATQIITREEHERLLVIERQAGMAAGKAEGLAQAKKNLQDEKKKIDDFLASVEVAFGEPSRFLDPLKKLAVHIAKEIVRGELQTSGVTINRLVEHCIASGAGGKPVAVHVNTQDLEWVRAAVADKDAVPELVADDNLARGSVKVMMNDGWIEDLIERRFEDIETSLHLD